MLNPTWPHHYVPLLSIMPRNTWFIRGTSGVLCGLSFLFYNGYTSLHTERMKFGEVKTLEVRLCLVSLGSIDRQTDLFWEHVLLGYAPTRSLKLLRHPMRHKIPKRFHALAVLCDASHLLHECSIPMTNVNESHKGMCPKGDEDTGTADHERQRAVYQTF